MAIPNLIALIGLSGVVVYETKKYFEEIKEEKVNIEWIKAIVEHILLFYNSSFN